MAEKGSSTQGILTLLGEQNKQYAEVWEAWKDAKSDMDKAFACEQLTAINRLREMLTQQLPEAAGAQGAAGPAPSAVAAAAALGPGAGPGAGFGLTGAAGALTGESATSKLDRIEEGVVLMTHTLPILFVPLKKQFGPPTIASRGSNEPFRKGLVRYYQMQPSTGQLRCMVLDKVLPKNFVCAGHLFAHRHKDYVDVMLGLKDISDPRNGLLWNSAIEEAYEYQKICFSHVSSCTFKLHVVDKELMATKLGDYGKDKLNKVFQQLMGGVTFGKLHGKEVTFANPDGMGPFKRALAFQAMNALSSYKDRYPDTFNPDEHNFDYMSDFDGKDDFIKAWLSNIPDTSSV